MYDSWSLIRNDRLEFSTANLAAHANVDLNGILTDPGLTRNWQQDVDAIHANIPPDGHGGVNYGDGRAIYYLISALNAKNVLEIGTHIGVSTAHVSAALRRQMTDGGGPAKLTTVDIIDVNDPIARPWAKNGAARSPREIVDNLGNGDLVEFVAQNSTEFLETCQQTFDFIFLDGSHAAEMVYRETHIALKLVNEGGVILLHDYFPDLEPLWSNNSVLPGPYLAGRKMQSECPSLSIIPLGELPWQTKLGSNMTSLALVTKQ